MGNRISSMLQFAALGALGGLAGVILRRIFGLELIPAFLPASLNLLAAPLAGGLIGAGMGYFSRIMIEKNEERLARLTLPLVFSVFIDGLLLGLLLA